MKRLKFITILAFALCLASCDFLHDDVVVARVGRQKLYLSQIEKLIPPGTSPEDSAAIAVRFIDGWARDLIKDDMAASKLSKKDKDVREELENYKKALLRYRFEQHYINERLDTTVSCQEILDYYASHSGQFLTKVPLMKVRLVKFAHNNPLKPQIVEMLTDEDSVSVHTLDSLCQTMLARFTDFSGKWIDTETLAKESDLNVNVLTEKVSGRFLDDVNDKGENCVVSVTDYIAAGNPAPVEYFADKIRENIISLRKYAISSSLEQDLLEQAAREGIFEIISFNETEYDK